MSRPALLASTILILVAAAGCTATGSIATPSVATPTTVVPPSAAASVAPSVAPSVLASVAPSAASSAGPSTSAGSSASGLVTTTTIDWGEIWDALPPSFPTYPGGQPTVTGGGPASATLDVPADGPAAIAWYQTALQGAGFTIDGANGPREDGSFLIDATSVASADCTVEVNLAPLGSTTTATIYVASACPFR